MPDIITDVLIDSLKVLPFLFGAYLLIELLETVSEEKTVALVHRAGKWGPVLGGALGIIPQCGFSAATANLYAGGIITRGTILAVFLSTSDEMLPIFLSESVPLPMILRVLTYKLAVGVIVGLLVDAVGRGEKRERIHELCEQEGCNCEEGVVKSALRHTVKIFAFLLLVNFLVSLAVETVGTERLASFILNKPVLGPLLSGLIGLIPNCAASVVITELYLQGGMTAGAMLAGLLVGSGVGILMLCRMNKNWKDNAKTIALLYASGVVFGCIAELLPVF